jgi:hypothetical protein
LAGPVASDLRVAEAAVATIRAVEAVVTGRDGLRKAVPALGFGDDTAEVKRGLRSSVFKGWPGTRVARWYTFKPWRKILHGPLTNSSL